MCDLRKSFLFMINKFFESIKQLYTHDCSSCRFYNPVSLDCEHKSSSNQPKSFFHTHGLFFTANFCRSKEYMCGARGRFFKYGQYVTLEVGKHYLINGKEYILSEIGNSAYKFYEIGKTPDEWELFYFNDINSPSIKLIE